MIERPTRYYVEFCSAKRVEAILAKMRSNPKFAGLDDERLLGKVHPRHFTRHGGDFEDFARAVDKCYHLVGLGLALEARIFKRHNPSLGLDGWTWTPRLKGMVVPQGGRPRFCKVPKVGRLGEPDWEEHYARLYRRWKGADAA